MESYKAKKIKLSRSLGSQVVDNYKFFTLAEISELLGISLVGLRNFIRAGKLDAMKMAGKWRVPKKSLDEFLASGGGGIEGANPRKNWKTPPKKRAKKSAPAVAVTDKPSAPLTDKEGE